MLIVLWPPVAPPRRQIGMFRHGPVGGILDGACRPTRSRPAAAMTPMWLSLARSGRSRCSLPLVRSVSCSCSAHLGLLVVGSAGCVYNISRSATGKATQTDGLLGRNERDDAVLAWGTRVGRVAGRCCSASWSGRGPPVGRSGRRPVAVPPLYFSPLRTMRGYPPRYDLLRGVMMDDATPISAGLTS